MTILATKPAASPSGGAWLGKGGPSAVDRLPRLADAMTEVARAMTESLGTLAASACEVAVLGTDTARVEELVARKPLNAVFVLAQAPGWGTTIALHYDQLFVSVLAQALFGASEDDVEILKGAALSPVEARIAEILAEHLAEALSKGFAEILPSAIAIEPIKSRPDPTRLGKPSVAVTVATFLVHTVGPPVEVDILIPQAALEAFDAELSAGVEGAPKADPGWSERLETEVSRARMKLQARLALPAMTLGAVARLARGQMLGFAKGIGSEAILSSGGTDLFRCELGQAAGHYCLKIEAEIAGGPPPHKDR